MTNLMKNGEAIAALRQLQALNVPASEVARWSAAMDVRVERIHALGGNDTDLGWYAKGHHAEALFRDAVEYSFWLTLPDGTRERSKHPCEADESLCHFVQQWWRCVPAGDGSLRFREAAPKARGSFPVTALLMPHAEI